MGKRKLINPQYGEVYHLSETNITVMIVGWRADRRERIVRAMALRNPDYDWEPGKVISLNPPLHDWERV